ncbi:hypothetical protein ACQP1G_17540 [Nocardia sp. CA-107356]
MLGEPEAGTGPRASLALLVAGKLVEHDTFGEVERWTRTIDSGRV